MNLRPVLMVALVAAGCGDSGPSFQSNCEAAAPSEEALAPARHTPDGTVILPDGRRISPAGTVLTTGGFPLQMRVLPQAGERYVVVTDGAYGDEHLRIIDTQAAATADPVVSNVDYIRTSGDARAPALFYGL